MNRRSPVRYFILLVIVLVAALAIMAILVMGRMNTLKAEAQKIVSMDMLNDSIDTTIYSSGEYADVETAMKNYISTYVNKLRSFVNTNNDAYLDNILTADNLAKDTADAQSSRAYNNGKINNVETLAEELKAMSKEANVLAAFEGSNEFFNWVYKTQMIDNITLGFYYPDEQIDAVKEEMLVPLNSKLAVLDFLAANAGKWRIENSAVTFDEDALLSNYLKLIEKL